MSLHKDQDLPEKGNTLNVSNKGEIRVVMTIKLTAWPAFYQRCKDIYMQGAK